ncbi:DivIVA domain-containing protein [Rhodohalobacter sp. 614A]|uniref:DivIVA domain-containing protein n=1 Tax=Rhodohalobacter sp. 614A TaxID=2908649 RepID=UPI001F217B51|nr:DivIVA domain-containing protein [Rhodohalobacter sp. 614A]
MKLTALEIKQQQFEKSLRGYDPAEVQSYLNLIASEWEHMVGKIRELETQVDKMNNKLKHYERVEEALHETLQTAKSSAEEKLSGAKKEASIIREKAEMEAEAIIKDANQERREIRQSIIQLIDKREEIIRSIKSYLENTRESLDQFSDDERSLFTVPDQPEFISKKESRKSPAQKPEKSNLLKDSDIPGAERIDSIIDELD